MQIAIIGIGAMGCLFGAKLSQVAEVTLFGHWPAQLAALQTAGLELITPDGRTQTTPLHATNSPPSVPSAHLALILVKSSQTAKAAQVAQQLLAKDGVALTLQNGLGNLETLTAVLGQDRTLIGTTSEGATIVQPGTVRHAGAGQTFIAASPETAVTNQIVELFQAAGFQTSLAANTRSLIWGKLAVNAGINPLTAVLQVPNGFLVHNEIAQNIMARAASEVAQVAAAQAIPLPFADTAVQALAVAQATAANQSSMHQDLAQGRPTEIEAICGAVVAYGRRHHIPTPVNQVLRTAVRQAEQGSLPIFPTPEDALQWLTEQIYAARRP